MKNLSLKDNIKKEKRFLLNKPGTIKLLPDIRTIWPYTMQFITGLRMLHDMIESLNRRGIEGSIVEMGCWRGGTGAIMSKWAPKRNVWMFDSFEGLPEFTHEDKINAKQKNLKTVSKDKALSSSGYLKIDEKDVHEILKKMNTEAHVVKGWFQDVLNDNKKQIGPIALLFLDGDLYRSYEYCLDELYDQVALGGYIVFDDLITFHGSRQALYEFFVRKKVYPYLQTYDYRWAPSFIIKN